MARSRTSLNSPSIVVAARFVTLALSLATAPIVARSLGPSGRGVAAAALTFLSVLPLLIGLGVPLGVRYWAARKRGGAALRSAGRYAFLALPLAIGAVLLVERLLLQDLDSISKSILFVAGATSSLQIYTLCAGSIFVVRKNFLGLALIQSSQVVAPTVVIVVTAMFGVLDVATVLAGSGLGNVLAFAFAVSLTRSIRSEGDEAMTARFLARRSLKFSGGQLGEVASRRVDQLFALPLLGSVQAGFYATSATLGNVPVTAGYAVGPVFFQKIASSGSREASTWQARSLRVGFLVCLAMVVPLLLAAPWIVPLVFGESFADAVEPTMILVAASPLLVANMLASQSLVARGRGHAITVGQVVGLVVGLAGLVVLGPRYGAEGAAVAASLGYVTTFATLLVGLRLSPVALIPARGDLRLLRDVLSRRGLR